MTALQRPPIKLVVNTSSIHGEKPVSIHAAARGKDVNRNATLRPRRIIQSPIIAPNHAPNIDNDATHEISCSFAENAHLFFFFFDHGKLINYFQIIRKKCKNSEPYLNI